MWVAMRSRNQRSWLMTTAQPGNSSSASSSARSVSTSRSLVGSSTCRFDADSWDPGSSRRGDVARALLYMELRYDGSDGGAPISSWSSVRPRSASGISCL
jgi:hypothetical protein